MDELEENIRQVLNDPGQMAQIMGLAQSLMGEGATPAPDPEASSGGGLLQKLGPLLQGGVSSDQQTLLRAMRPYLSEKRQQKIDRAIQLTRMAKLARLALEQAEDGGHA